MRFLKEILAITFISIFVFSINIISENITQNAVLEINNNMEILEKDMKKNDIINTAEKIDMLRDIWNKKNDKLSFFIEHSELEKVSDIMEDLKIYIENDKKQDVLEGIKEIKFILNRIEEKYKLKLNNIF